MELLLNYAKNYGINLDEKALERFENYYNFLVEYNQHTNLTSITEKNDVIIKHFLDSIILTKFLKLNSDTQLIDVGTGAGFPGVPLAIASGAKVTLLDSLTKLTRAYQAAQAQNGRPVSNTVTPAALVRPKRFFGAARNTRDGGSLTVVATIATGTGSRVDDIIFEEFKGTANMELVLCAPASGDPIRPMIDLQRSGTKKDDMLLDDRRKESLRSIRQVLGSTTNGEAVVQLIDMMQKTKCNEDLLTKLQEWMVLWEKSGYLKR